MKIHNKVRDESGNEDIFSGLVHVLKLDIEQEETNVCWKSSACTLKLTDDSSPGGIAQWTSSPEGISGSGNSITFNPSSLTPGEYTVTARSGIVASYADTCIVRVVEVVGLEHQIGSSVMWKAFNKPQKILYKKIARLHAQTIPDTISCGSAVNWEGSYGVRGVGLEKVYTYSGPVSTSDSDVKSVLTSCGPNHGENFLVCPFVVGIHSNAGPTNSFSDGHAWLTLTSFKESSPATVSFGLWGNRPQVSEGTDVHIGLESNTGRYNRYFLLAPSQVEALVEFVAAKCEWGHFYTCANWAEDGYRIASGETISSSDFVVFGTPRAVGASIDAAERTSPTQLDIPQDGEEEATSSSSTSGGSVSVSSFP